MKILVAEDDAVSRTILVKLLKNYEVITAVDGTEAMRILSTDDPPQLALLDWMMPGASGIEICRWLQSQPKRRRTFVIVVTARSSKAEIVEALDAGADDCITKPYDPGELEARMRVGQRCLALEAGLAQKVRELEEATAHVDQLQGLIPICMHCRRIRDEGERWERVEKYIQERSQAVFSHALCDDCLDEQYPETQTLAEAEAAGAERPRRWARQPA